MNEEELVKIVRNYISQIKEIPDGYDSIGILIEIKEFFRKYMGEKSEFYKEINSIEYTDSLGTENELVISVLEAFIRYVENGLIDEISIERQAQIDVVSDFLDQANTLLNDNSIHPATPTIIIGCALEEFLRNWIEEANLNLDNQKLSIDTYKRILKKENLITKQDDKDIISWAGLRNDAAHGRWDLVNDRKRVRLMLEGVNLFMRKYSKSK